MAFLGGDMSNHRVRLFSTAFKEDVVRRLGSGEALAAVSKELGIARKLLYEWRWAWRRHGAAGLNRRRGPKKGLRRKMATSDPPGAALASSAPSAEGTELARAAPGGSLVAIFRLSPFLGPRRRFKPAAPWRRHAQRHSYNSFLAIPNSFETAAKASPDPKRLTTSSLNAVENKRTR